MKRGLNYSLAVLLALVCVLSIIIGCSSETDEQLLSKLDTAIQSGSFHNRPGALEAVSKLLTRGNIAAKDTEVVDYLITTGALLLDDDAEWIYRDEARDVYNLIKRYDDEAVVDGLARKIIQDTRNRLHVLFLGIKLGIPGSEERLNQVLYEHGDANMAEDFLNSGSSKLSDGGERWAYNNGYTVTSGMGSNRASWGSF